MFYTIPVKKPSIRQLLIAHLPDFAWQTSYEILTMLEVVDEDISENALKVLLHALWKKKLLDRKTVTRYLISRGSWKTSMYRKFSE